MAESSIRLKVEAGGAVAALNQTSAASRRVSKSVNVLGAALKALPFIGIAEAARRFFGGFAEADKATAAVRTLGVDADKLKIKLLGVSNELKGLVSQTQLTAAAYDVASAGFTDAAEAAEILRAATLGAVGGLSDLNTVADATTSVLNSYGLSSDKAAGLVDKFIQTQNDGKIVVAQYASQIGRVAPIAAAAGVGIDELNAAISAVTATGVPVESTFAGLRQAIASVIKPTKEAEDASKLLGIEFSSAAIKSKGFGGFLEDVIDKTGGSEVALTKLFGSVEAVATILPLANDKLVKFNSSLDNQRNSAGAADRATKDLGGTVSAQTTSIVNNIGNVARGLDRLLGPALKNILSTVNNLFSKVSTLLELLNDANLGKAYQEIFKANLSSEGGAASQAVDNLVTAVSALDSNLIKSEEDARKFEKVIGRISFALTKARGEGFADEKAADRARQLTLVLDDYHDTLKAIKATGFEAAGSAKPEALGGVNPELEAEIKKLEALLNAKTSKGGSAPKGEAKGLEAQQLKAGAKLSQQFTRQIKLREASSEIARKELQIDFKRQDALAEIAATAEIGQQAGLEELANKVAILDTEEAREELALEKQKREQEREKKAAEAAQRLIEADPGFQMRAQFEELIKLENQVAAGATAIGGAFSNAFIGVISGAKSAQQGLAEMMQSVAQHFLDMATKIIAQQLAMILYGTIMKALGVSMPGGGGGMSFSDFSGSMSGGNPFTPGGSMPFTGFANGGRPPVGRPSIVGERGPELFVPGTSGTIIPNHALGGGANVTVNVDASGSSVEGDSDQASQLGKMLGAAVQAELIKQKRPGGLLSS